jgi:hypothetical protein
LWRSPVIHWKIEPIIVITERFTKETRGGFKMPTP